MRVIHNLFSLIAFAVCSSVLCSQPAFRPQIPKTWDDAALADWATPLAALNLRPTHISSNEYYSMSVENLRTYPVYFPGREPDGYWERLKRIGPKPLIEPGRLKTEAEWVEVGKIVFEEADFPQLRTYDPKFIAMVRSPATFAAEHALPDGTVFDMRWVPTSRGVALTFPNCSQCHLAYQKNGNRIPGAPAFANGSTRNSGTVRIAPVIPQVQRAHRVITGSPPFVMSPEPLGMSLYRAFGVPWIPDDINEKIKSVTAEEYIALATEIRYGGGVPRWNGSLYYPTKVPDLIGIKDRKYIDHTATHLHRGIGDLMRYAALVSFAETADFGGYHMLSEDAKRVNARLPDEALYALALYIYSLQPPINPNPFDSKAEAGKKIFAQQGCPVCHAAPLYTSNKLTLAQGFDPPKGAPATLDISRIRVGTDPGLALKTRKGTGYYKVPSLKGVWYRAHYLHDGSATTLEEMFDPERLNESHTAEGWRPVGAQTHAIKGHEFGLKLDPTQRQQLIAFLRTL